MAITSLFVQWVGADLRRPGLSVTPRLNRLPAAWAALAVVLLVVIDTLIFSVLARLVMAWVSDSIQPTTLWGRKFRSTA